MSSKNDGDGSWEMKLRKWLLLCMLLYAHQAMAIITGCALTGWPSFAPQNPGSNDRIQYGVSLHPALVYYGPYWAYSRATVESDYQINKLSIDLIVSPKQLTLPGYQESPVAYDYPYDGSIGTLPPGIYSATATLKTYDPVQDAITNTCSARDPVYLIVAAASVPVVTSPVVEFYSATLDHYFITQDAKEISILDAGGAWIRTGETFLAYLPGMSDGRGRAVSRFYGLPEAGLDSHFYTWSVLEIARTEGLVPWYFETDDAFEIEPPTWPEGSCRTGTVPVYRLWNGRSDSAHRYATKASIKQTMIEQGYVPEGYGPDAVFMCAISN